MRTLDGLAYDFQQVGEYVFLTEDASFTVQARLAPYGDSSSAAINIAAAANVGGDRVAYYIGANQPLLVNGASAAVPVAGLTLPHGGRLTRSTTGYLIVWPTTGEQLSLEPWGTFLNITITVPDKTKPYRGLLGTWDGNPNNDLVARTGQTFTSSITLSDLYGAFGDSWRIIQNESLFDYAPGQDTTTFTDDAFPSHPLTAATLPTEQFNQAHAACTAAGVVNTAELQDCVLDVAASTTATPSPVTAATVAQAAASTTLPPPVVVVKPWGYSQDFEMLSDGRWAPTTVNMMPALDALEATVVLGPFASGEAAALTLDVLPQHSSITVAFDTQVVGPWNGDAFQLIGDSNGIAVTTTFSNLLTSQSFPDQTGVTTHPAQTGALAAGSVDLGQGSEPRAVYHHSYSFVHSAAGIQLSFVAPNLPSGAAWTLDNIEIITSNVGDPWSPKCTSNGSPLDDHNACTIDSCDPSMGVLHTPRPAGISCSDGNLCNGEETCNAFGWCVGIPPVVDDHNPCTADSCDAQLGVVHTTLAAGTSCSDGQFCNGAETCNNRAECRPGTPPNPATLPPDTTCNGVDDDCSGAADEDYVATTTHCGKGACSTTGRLLCDHGSKRDTCTPLFASAHDTICDGIDDNCNGQLDEEYQPVCMGTNATACSNAMVATVSCDDHDPCTSDGCSTGACTHVSTCDDGNPCTADGCDSVLGCTHVIANGALCSDDNACTGGDTCSAMGTCLGAAVNIDDNNVCTDDTCNPIIGPIHVPVAGRQCSDNDACTMGEICDAAGQCQGGGVVSCSDGVFCNGAEICIPASGCAAGLPLDPDDQIGCTVDSCDEATDTIKHEPNDEACSDSDVCTGAESCNVVMGCIDEQGLSVDDNNPCTSDVCDPFLGATHPAVAEGTACGAGKYCNAAGSCTAFTPCAANLVVATGQNLSFTGPCEIDAITFSGGNLTINGALKTGSITMAQGGTLNVNNAGSLITSGVTLSYGTIKASGNIIGSITQSGGNVELSGTYSVPASGTLAQSGGTFLNRGSVTVSSFNTVVTGGTFINNGQLNLTTNVLTVPSGVILSENGKVNATDTVETLTVDGTLTHERGQLNGLVLNVNGNATINGSVGLTGTGLRGTNAAGISGPGQYYQLINGAWTPVSIGGGIEGGSHGGMGGSGGPIYDSVTEPSMLGSGGSGNPGGSGGGRVKLFVGQKLQLNGGVLADAVTSTNGAGGGGGAIWLRAGELAGAGAISANGGSGNYWPLAGGGGRIALEYAVRSHTGRVQASGAMTSGQSAGAGTVYERNTNTSADKLVIGNVDNNGMPTTSGIETVLPAGTALPSSIEIKGSTVRVMSSAVLASVSLSAGTLTVDGDLSIAQRPSLAAGKLIVKGALLSPVTVAGGTLSIAGSYSVANTSDFTLSSGTCEVLGTMTLPEFNSTNMKGGTFLNKGQLNITDNIITVPSGVTLSENGSVNATDTVETLTVNGTLTHERGQLNGLVLNVNGNATINGSIALIGMGLRGVNAAGISGPGQYYQLVNGAWTPVSIGGGILGGSHGGMGGNGGPIYDSVTEPSMLGSGGDGNPGGSGGGRVKLFVGQKLQLNGGGVLADAVTSTNGAGGAGGAIWLKAGELAGAGAISANGGSGSYWPLAGGGGRIALEYAVKSHTGRVQASGAMTSGQSAGAGTVYERNTNTSADKLVVGNVDNNGVPTTSGIETVLPAGTAIPSAIEVKGSTLHLTSSANLSSVSLSTGALIVDANLTIAQRPSLMGGTLIVKGALLSPVTVAGGTLSIVGSYTVANTSDFTLSSGTCEVLGTMTLPEFSSTNMKGGTFNNKGQLNITDNILTVPSGVILSENGTVNATDTVETLRVDGTLTHELAQVNGLVLNVNGNATINGSIALAGKGLRGTNSWGISGPGQYYKLVNGAWTPTLIGGGIEGGSHGGMGGSGGPIYDSMTEPSMLGSGGNGNPGGSGGGRVKLFVGQKLLLNGSVLADAVTSTNGAGGGGGAIWLKAMELAGAGAISANGGSGNYWPLAGGGGRIALEYAVKSHTGSVQASGATASGQSAGAGTVYERNTSN